MSGVRVRRTSRRRALHEAILASTRDVCAAALEEALARFGTPELFNTDQGSQGTSVEFFSVLRRRQIAISMDGTGCWRDTVFVERLWRSVRDEDGFFRADHLSGLERLRLLRSAGL